MSDDEDTPDDGGDGMSDAMDRLEQRVDTLADIAIENDEELEGVKAELARLADAVEDLQDRTEMLQGVRETQASVAQKRTAHVLQTLRNTADRSDTDQAALDAHGILTALGGDVARSTAYDVMDSVVRAVGDENVCWKETHGRSDEKNTRVRLDLSAGDVPASHAGVQIRGEN